MPVHKRQFISQAGRPQASQNLPPATVGTGSRRARLTGSSSGLSSGDKTETSPTETVRRPHGEPPSCFDSSRKARPLHLQSCPPPMAPGGAQRGAAPGSRPSPAGRSCFLCPSKRFVPGHKFCSPVGQARMYALVNTVLKNMLPG